MADHPQLVLDSNHAITARTYADIAARDADPEFHHHLTSVDKVVRVNTDPVTYYVLSISGNPSIPQDPVWEEITGSAFDEFTKLTDTPGTISAGLVVQGNSGGTALEFGQALDTSDSPTFAAITIGASIPFADAAGVLTLKNVDAIDSTTETTIEAAIDNLPNLGSVSGQTFEISESFIVSGETEVDQNLTTASDVTFGTLSLDAVDGALLNNRLTTTQRDALTPVAGMSIYNTDTDDIEFYNGVAWQSMGGGDVSGDSSSIDNAIARFNGTGGKNIQNSDVLVTDAGNVVSKGLVWTSRTSVGGDKKYISIVYGNGLFVALASVGTGTPDNLVMTSPDGVNWTSQATPANNNWNGLVFGNGLFVAVSNTGALDRAMTSPDGVNWTLRTTPNNNQWRSLTYGNNLFVAVAASGTGDRVMTSPDGITWTLRTSAADETWNGVTFGNGLFVAIAQNGVANAAMTSPDGITWTIRATPTTNNWGAVTYGNGLFVAVAQGGAGDRVITSPDGITWTSRTSPGNDWLAVTYGGGLFVAVATDGTGDRVMTSIDGITWVSRSSAADNSWRGVGFGNGMFVAVSTDGTDNRVMTSGITEKNVIPLNNGVLSRKPLNVVEVFKASDIPNNLVNNTRYLQCAPIIIVNGDEKIFPTDANIEFETTNRLANTITYSGTGTLFSGGTIAAMRVGTQINSSSTGTLYSLTGNGPFSFHFMLDGQYNDWTDLGTLTGFGTFGNANCFISNFGDGFKYVSCDNYFQLNATFANAVDSGNDFLTFDANIESIAISNSRMSPLAGEHVFNINSAATVNALISNILGVSVTSRYFNPAGLDKTSPGVQVTNSSNIADSKAIGSFNFNGNSDSTAVVDGTYTAIDITGLSAGANIERFSVSDATEGELTYNGFADFAGTLIAAFYSGSTPSEANYRLAISINGAVPVFATAPYVPLSLKDTGDGATVVFPVSLTTGDTIQVMIAGDGTGIDVAIAHGQLSIQ